MSYRTKMLNEASNIVDGNRDKEYGTPENNFKQIADLWNAYLNRKPLIEEVDVANMLILLKLVRAKHNPKHLDSFVDIAGYAACNYEIVQKQIDLYTN